MKRIFVLVLIVTLLCGCSADTSMDRVLNLRQALLNADECSFQTRITADYGEKIYSFTMECRCDREGNLNFAVLQPETICGITGEVSAAGGLLTFDDKALAFELLADGQITPVSAPWLLMRTLRGGYISACSGEGDSLLVQMDDSYEENALQLDIRLDSQAMPVQADILYQGRRIVSMEVIGFHIS